MYRDNFFSFEDMKSALNPAHNQASGSSPYFQLMHNPLVERLFESSPCFIYVVSLKNYRIVYASPNMEHLLGYDHEDLIDNDYETLQMLFAKEDMDKVTRADLKFLELLAEAPGQHRHLKCVITSRMQRSNGTMIPIQLQKVVLDTDSSGKPALMMGMIMDITCGGKKSPDFCSTIMFRDPLKGWTEIAAAGRPCSNLSNREKEILLLLSKGKSSKIIASELDISVNTVNNHRKNMLLKTKTGNIAGLLSHCISQGII